MSSRPKGLPNEARTWKPPALVKIYSKGSLIFSEPTAFLSVPLSCSWSDRKVHDSHGYRAKNVGTVKTCFYGTRTSLPFIAATEHPYDLVSTKTESVYIKKRSVDIHCAQHPRTCVISCSTSSAVAFFSHGVNLLHSVYNGSTSIIRLSVSLWMCPYLSVSTV